LYKCVAFTSNMRGRRREVARGNRMQLQQSCEWQLLEIQKCYYFYSSNPASRLIYNLAFLFAASFAMVRRRYWSRHRGRERRDVIWHCKNYQLTNRCSKVVLICIKPPLTSYLICPLPFLFREWSIRGSNDVDLLGATAEGRSRDSRVTTDLIFPLLLLAKCCRIPSRSFCTCKAAEMCSLSIKPLGVAVLLPFLEATALVSVPFLIFNFCCLFWHPHHLLQHPPSPLFCACNTPGELHEILVWREWREIKSC